MDRRAWQATVHAVVRVRHDLATKPYVKQFCTRYSQKLLADLQAAMSKAEASWRQCPRVPEDGAGTLPHQ